MNNMKKGGKKSTIKINNYFQNYHHNLIRQCVLEMNYIPNKLYFLLEKLSEMICNFCIKNDNVYIFCEKNCMRRFVIFAKKLQKDL